MPWRFADPASAKAVVPPNLWPGPFLEGRTTYDPRIERYRWAFSPRLLEACVRAGCRLTPYQASVVAEAELHAAFLYIDAQPADGNIFGVIYDATSGALPNAEIVSKANRSRLNAETSAKHETNPETPEWERGGFADGAKEIVYDLLRDYNPNDIGAAVRLVPFLTRAKRPIAALAEWCDVYCRVYSVAAAIGKTAPNDPALRRVLAAVNDSVNAHLATELELYAHMLGVDRLYGIDRHYSDRPYYDSISRMAWVAARPASASTISQSPIANLRVNILPYTMTYAAGNLNQAYDVTPTQGSVGLVKRARQDLRTLMDFWRATLLPFYPAWLKEVLLAVASALAKALARELSTAIRALAGAALGDIPLPETIDMLKVHANDSDQTVRAAVQQSIASIQLALRDQTPALDWTQ
jgi:hypothetical protein